LKLNSTQQALINRLILLSLDEDIGDGDHTSLACIPENAIQKAKLLIKEEGILCGTEMAIRICQAVDPALRLDLLLNDATPVKPGMVAFLLEGPARSILMAERLILNCMQRMSGIATYTKKLSNKIAGTRAILLDTRKTSPGMRLLEKWAVLTGGGQNHRMGLFDMIMIKDNHIDYAGGIENAINRVHAYLKLQKLELKIEIEARNPDDIQRIIKRGGVNRIMLDNFSPEEIRAALPIINGKYETEASGGIAEHNLLEYALTGVDFISVGALTHQIRSLDLSLKAC
jgi:nicotinate-nucleotide pyrophosphorylase (carboxylating)